MQEATILHIPLLRGGRASASFFGGASTRALRGRSGQQEHRSVNTHYVFIYQYPRVTPIVPAVEGIVISRRFTTCEYFLLVFVPRANELRVPSSQRSCLVII